MLYEVANIADLAVRLVYVHTYVYSDSGSAISWVHNSFYKGRFTCLKLNL